jgi:hypothetical protein
MKSFLPAVVLLVLLALVVDDVVSRLSGARDEGERTCLVAAFDSCVRNSNDGDKCPDVARNVCALR